MARAKTNTVLYFPHYVTQDKFLFTLKRKYKADGYSLYYGMLEILGSSEDHFYDMSLSYDKDYFIEYIGIDRDKADEILQDLAEWDVIDKELYKNGIIWSQQFVDNITDVYRKRQRKVPDRYSICHRMGIESDKPEQAVDGNPQSKVEESKSKESSSTSTHHLRIFILQHFPNVSSLRTQLTDKDCEGLIKKYPRELIIDKLESMENKKNLVDAYTSVRITLNSWCKQDLPKYQKSNASKAKYRELPNVDGEKEYERFIQLAKEKGIKIKFPQSA